VLEKERRVDWKGRVSDVLKREVKVISQTVPRFVVKASVSYESETCVAPKV